jgi:hypothetical protein
MRYKILIIGSLTSRQVKDFRQQQAAYLNRGFLATRAPATPPRRDDSAIQVA